MTGVMQASCMSQRLAWKFDVMEPEWPAVDQAVLEALNSAANVSI
jgi:hypothetical protein